MEPLGATASILTVLHVSSQVIQYINTASGATKERKLLRNELRACEHVLEELKDNADDLEEGKAWAEKITALEAAGAPLGRLLETLNLVKNKLEPKEGFRKTLTSLTWPFKEKEVMRIIDAIQRELSLLHLARTNDSRRLIIDIKRTSEEHEEQLKKLIQAVDTGSRSNENHFQQLECGIAHVQASQTNLSDGIGRLHIRQDDRETAEERREILNWLNAVDYTAQHHDYAGRRQGGTGQWLLDSPKYQNWVKADKQTLFCPGIPGAGKTFITSLVIDDLNRRFQDDPSVGIAYVYCNFRRTDEQTIEKLLASLLEQLACGKNSPLEPLKDLYFQHEKRQTRPSLDDLFKALRSIANLHSKTFVILDALDECHASIESLLSYILDSQDECGINLFATSRFILDIMAHFVEKVELEISASSHDVKSFLEARLNDVLGVIKRNESLREEIQTTISEAVKGMFLLARLHLDSLRGKPTVKAVRKALSRFYEQDPGSSEDQKIQVLALAYKDAMERINGQEEDLRLFANKVLSWIVCAKRPLSTLELQHALAVEVGEPDLDEENIPEVEQIIAVCAGLVTVDLESDVIRLVHYTAQEYLEQTKDQWFSDPEGEITETCIAYLSFKSFTSGACLDMNALEQRLNLNPFYEYSATNWGHHAREMSIAKQHLILNFLSNDAIVSASSEVLLKPGIWEGYVTHWAKGLHLAVCFGLIDALKGLQMSGHNQEERDDLGRTPLSWAAGYGQDATVALLLNSVDVNSQDHRGQTPLSWAAKNGHEGVVKELLAIDQVDVNSRDFLQGTALTYAAQSGHYKVIRLLLSVEGIDINYQNKARWTALMIAVGQRHYKVVSLLLSAERVEVNHQDNPGCTALMVAADQGHHKVISLLLGAEGVEVNHQDNQGCTALMMAADQGHHKVISLLLGAEGVKVNHQDNQGYTALIIAAGQGYYTVISLLLSVEEVKVNYQSNKGWTALMVAAGRGHYKVISLLLSVEGVEVDHQDCAGQTALAVAAERGYSEVTKLLLAADGVVVDWNALYRATAFWQTASIALLETIKVLDLHHSSTN